MRLFNFVFRKFEKESTSIEAVETWVVKWESLSDYCGTRYWESKPEFRTFIDEEQAQMFKKEIEASVALLGDKDRMVELYKQEYSTNSKGEAV